IRGCHPRRRQSRETSVRSDPLVLTYDQMVEAGIGRQYCSRAIKEAERRGLIDVNRGRYWGAARTAPTRFRITYLKAKVEGFDPSLSYYTAPTNEWLRFGTREK